MKVRIKKLNDFATIPAYATDGSAGMDITAISKTYDDDGNIVYGTGLAFEIPEGYVGLLFPRSSNAKKDLILSNSVGVIDSDYRGEVSFKFKPSYCFNKDDMDVVYDVGDRVGQMIIVPYPHIEWEEVKELLETKRIKRKSNQLTIADISGWNSNLRSLYI